MASSTILLMVGSATIIVVLLVLALVLRGLSSSEGARRGHAGNRRLESGGRNNQPASLASGEPRTTSEAAALLDRIAVLRKSEAGWPTILDQLNPGDDSAIADDLLALRGPHLFAPHLALDIVASECRGHIGRVPPAGAKEIIAAARRSAERITRFGD